MPSVAMSGNDTVIINNRVMNDLADGDCAVLTFETDIATVKVGKNGNAIFGLNENGKVAGFVLRLVRGSSDDKFMNNLLIQQQANFAGFPLINGEFVKKVGDGAAAVAGDTYIASGGINTRQVDAKSNVEGDTEQSVSIYRLKFASAARAIT